MSSHYRLLTYLLPDRIARFIFPTTPPISTDGFPVTNQSHFESEKRVSSLVSSLDKRCATINALPDDVLLRIFHFDRVRYLEDVDQARRLPWRWHRLVHVCRKWRSVAFSSPSLLHLRLVCGPSTRAELTDIWPPLPIVIRNMVERPMPKDYDFDAAIVHHNHYNRICQIHLLYLISSQLKRLSSAMQVQFPALIHLKLGFLDHYRRPAPALPDGFLGGSAPRLQSLALQSIPFPALPKLLLSTTGLVRLSLWNIPHSGYISPEALVTGLAALANLKCLIIKFESPLSRPDRENRHPPPPTRTALPALIRFDFQGVSEYLEDFLAQIDAPLLDSIRITFFHQLIFDIPQLALFMRRTAKFETADEAHVDFYYYGIQIESLPPTRTFGGKSGLGISCRKLDWQLSSLAQVLTSFLPSAHLVEHLYIHRPRYLSSQDDIENMQWLEIFHPFTAVKNLYVCKEFTQCITSALQELVGKRVIDALPALESLFLEELQPSGPVQEAIGHFISARQILGHPVTVSQWNRTPSIFGVNITVI